MKRFFEIMFALIFLSIFFPAMTIIILIIKLGSNGPVIHWSKRVGINNKIFLMPKFRTMHIDTPQVATHLLESSSKNITSFGNKLRKYSLDELPQLISIIKNDMSFVGPRPALFNQSDLIELRTKNKIHKIKPGITGWAQINGRDNISLTKKVELDYFYLVNKNLSFDLKIVFLTIIRVLIKKNIIH